MIAMTKLKFVLGIETSCDETAAAVLQKQGSLLKKMNVSGGYYHSTPYFNIVTKLTLGQGRFSSTKWNRAKKIAPCKSMVF